jgi:arginine/lysine/ornithine decarboxylase
MNKQDQTPLFDALMEYAQGDYASFHIPGHRNERGINQKWLDFAGPAIFAMDQTETPLLDDLHNPSGVIKQAQDLAAEVFSAQECFFLVNGTTCGNEAALTTIARTGEKVLIPRNAHKSALMGLIISGATPRYIMPELSKEWGVHGGIDPAKVTAALARDPDLKGMLIVSPTYYGLTSNLESIAAICHQHGIPLIVDEAHGAHLYFSELLPSGAMQSGADLCSQSIHKVTGSLTQSSMLQLNSSLIDRGKLAANLHIVQSTSPSYLLMASLDLARHDLAMRGPGMIHAAIKLADWLRNAINELPGFSCFGEEIVGTASIDGFDSTRLTISGKDIGLTGFALKETLFTSYGIDVELCDYLNVLAIVTFANERRDGLRLLDALKTIGQTSRLGHPVENLTQLPDIPRAHLTPREAHFADWREIPWQEARGAITAEMIAPYPPGIPVVYPGEEISPDVHEFIEIYRENGRPLQGPTDAKLDKIRIIPM